MENGPANDVPSAPPRAPREPVDLGGAASRLLHDVRIAAIVTDPEGRVVSINRRARAMFPPGEAGPCIRQWPARLQLGVQGQDGPCPIDRFPPVTALAGDAAELEMCRPDGLWIAVEGHPLTDAGGRILGAITFARDITRRKQIERTLASEQARLEAAHRRQAALATIQQAISEPHELRGALQQIVDLATRHVPCTAASIVLWNDQTESFEVSASTVHNQDGGQTARRVRRHGGASRWIVDHARPLVVTDIDCDPFGANAMLAEEHLRSYAGLPLINDGEVIGVLYALDDRPRHYSSDDLDFLTSLASRAATALGKVALYQQLRDLNAALNLRTSELAEHRSQLEKLVEQRTSALRESVNRLRVADRLASVGTLTAGLGHDINNILFPIRCRLEALDWSRVPDDLQDTLSAVTHATEYLQQLSDGLRLFARDPEKVEAIVEVTDLGRWWSQVRPLLVKTLPSHVTLVEDVPRDLPAVRVAPHRLTQAVLNLVVNASEAIQARGSVRVAAAAAAVEGEQVIRLTVADDGHGMTPEVRSRIFDPFFTTKKRGLSTGLGLSLVHGVIRSSAGASIDVESMPGEGTTFIMTFPVADEPEPDTRDRAASRVAAVRIGDPRVAAWVEQYRAAAGCRCPPDSGRDRAALLVTDAADGSAEIVRGFLECDSNRRVILCGPAEAIASEPGVIHVSSPRDLPAIRRAILIISGINEQGTR